MECLEDFVQECGLSDPKLSSFFSLGEGAGWGQVGGEGWEEKASTGNRALVPGEALRLLAERTCMIWPGS